MTTIPTPWDPLALGNEDTFGIDLTRILARDNSTISGQPTVTAPPALLTISNVGSSGGVVVFSATSGTVPGLALVSCTFSTTTRGPITVQAYLPVGL